MLQKIKENKAIFVICAIAIMTFAMSAMCFATDGDTTSSDYSTLITQLNNGLGANAFIGVIGDVLPYIITVTIVALVWYLVRRAIKKFAKGKPGV